MAVDSRGTRNQPLFDGSKASNLAADLNAVSNFAALTGNRKVGTHAARLALSGADVWDGLEFYETDQTDGLHDTYIYDGNASAWITYPVVGAVNTTGLFSLSSGWSFSYGGNNGTQAWFKTGGRVEFYFSFFRSSSTTINDTSDGNLVNVNVGQFTVTPRVARSYVSGLSGRLASITVTTSGDVFIDAITPGGDIHQGDAFSFSGDFTY